MSLFGNRNRTNDDATSPSVRSVERTLDRDPIEWANGVRIVRPGVDVPLELEADSVLHVAAQYVAQGRAQVADYAAGASAAIRELLADAKSRRFEAVQQAKARRLMLQSYRAALQRQADAQRILGPHVRFSGAVGKNLWVLLFLMGDAAGMTLALTYGGESPVIAAVMALAVGAAVVVSGKLGEELRRESFVKRSNELGVEGGDEETLRVVEAVFGVDDASLKLNRRVLYAFMGTSMLAGAAITVYRSYEGSFGVGLSFGMWALMIGAGSFACSWYYCDPARTFIDLTQQAVIEAEDIWRSAEMDAIEEHNANIEAAKHIVREHRQRAEAAWHMTLAGAAAAMSANSEVIGIAQKGGHWLLKQRMPDVDWPDLTAYLDIIDQDDVAPEDAVPNGAGLQQSLVWPLVEREIDQMEQEPTWFNGAQGKAPTPPRVAVGS